MEHKKLSKEELKKLYSLKVFWDGKNDLPFIENFPEYTFVIDNDNRQLNVMDNGEVRAVLKQGSCMRWCPCMGEDDYPTHFNVIRLRRDGYIEA